MSDQDTERWAKGTRVVVRNVESWAANRTGTVIGNPSNMRGRCTVELDGGGRYLASDDELRTAPPRRTVRRERA